MDEPQRQPPPILSPTRSVVTTLWKFWGVESQIQMFHDYHNEACIAVSQAVSPSQTWASSSLCTRQAARSFLLKFYTDIVINPWRYGPQGVIRKCIKLLTVWYQQWPYLNLTTSSTAWFWWCIKKTSTERLGARTNEIDLNTCILFDYRCCVLKYCVLHSFNLIDQVKTGLSTCCGLVQTVP